MNKNKIPAVEKTIEIMELLAAEAEGLTQTEIIRRTGISSSTGYRILQTLLFHGWVSRKNTRYVPQDAFRKIKNPLGNLLQHAQGVLDHLSQETRLGCKLSVRRGNRQLSVMGAESPEPFAVNGKIGSYFPLVEGGVGAALLAMDSADGILNAVAESPEKIPETADPALIFGRIDEFRKNGFILNSVRNRWKVRTMSAPVIAGGRVLAALTILGMNENFPPQAIQSLAAALLNAKQQMQIFAGEKDEN